MTDNPSNIPQQLLGFWKVVGGDYPLTDEYRADGTLVQHVGDRTSDPIPFRIEGDQLISTLEQPDGTTSEQRERFELSGDKLTFIDSDGSTRVFQRNRDGNVGGGPQSPKPWWK